MIEKVGQNRSDIDDRTSKCTESHILNLEASVTSYVYEIRPKIRGPFDGCKRVLTKLNLSPLASKVDSLEKDRTSFSSYSTAATERTTTAMKIILLSCVLYIWILVEESVATGISAMAVFVSFNGGHDYFKFQSYGTVTHKINLHNLLIRFLTVNEKDKF